MRSTTRLEFSAMGGWADYVSGPPSCLHNTDDSSNNTEKPQDKDPAADSPHSNKEYAAEINRGDLQGVVDVETHSVEDELGESWEAGVEKVMDTDGTRLLKINISS